MAKSEETKRLEKAIWKATNKTGVFGCFEVTIGFHGNERVDYLTYDTKGIWKCYELKISKEDFYSDSKVTFVGHYNYYVFPDEKLYKEVEKDIPPHVGVYINTRCVKKAKKQKLETDEEVLKISLIRSLYREVEKKWESDDEELIERLNRSIQRLKRKSERYYKLLIKLEYQLFKKFGPYWTKEIFEGTQEEEWWNNWYSN